jgi:hypothetical protein
VLSQVNVTSASGEILQLVLADVSDGYVLEDIGGLGPVKATLVSTGFANQDGVQPQSAKREQRDLSFKIGLEPYDTDTTVQELRQQLYNFFMTKAWVTVEFQGALPDDTIVPTLTGQVESCEPDIFTQEPVMNIMVTCFDPDIYDLDVVTVTGNTTSGTTPGTVDYPGTVEAGVIFKLNVNRTLAAFTIFNTPPGETPQQLDFSASLVSGDVVTISTVPGNKYATLTRGGVDSDILYGISPQSGWIELKKGANAFRVYASGAAIPWTMDYSTKYGGL